MDAYSKIIEEFSAFPRDVSTVPTTERDGKWFYVFVKNGELYVESGHEKEPKSAVRRRKLKESECLPLLGLYHRRESGEAVYAEAHRITYSQVYWYGIFEEMNM